MKRVLITRSLWHPKSRTMEEGYFTYRMVIGIKTVAYCCHNLLTVIGLGQYRIGRRDA
jgi:ABC-type cobalt transport system substrate-binding protein